MVHKSKYLFACAAEQGYASHQSDAGVSCTAGRRQLSISRIPATTADERGMDSPLFPLFQRPDLILSHKGSIVTIRR
jgi:hypothetical protein